jgi:hypothetical protein
MIRTFIIVLAILHTACAFAQKKPSLDAVAIHKACYNYIDAFYKGDTTLAYKSVHSSLQKRGFFFSDKTNSYSEQLEMPFPALIHLAKTWNKVGKRANEKSIRKVQIFEIADKIATAKVTAVWGIDYIQLAKFNNEWLIINVLWQSPPKSLHTGQ